MRRTAPASARQSLRHADDDRTRWTVAAGIALAAHLGVAALVLGRERTPLPPRPAPEPVMLVELPAAPGPARPSPPEPAAASQAAPAPVPLLTAPAVALPVRAAPALPPLAQPVSLPAQPAVMTPVAPAAAPPAASPPATAGGATSSAQTATDPHARKAEVDYFGLVSAYLNRRKAYPVEARQARQEGVVTVRFTVSRDGAVTGATVKRSSGHDILDQATLALLARVAPLPRMPAAMARDSVTLALPIAYSLKTS